MKLTSPDIPLLLWTLHCALWLLLSIAGAVHLIRRRDITRMEALGWLLTLFLLPVVGAAVYFAKKGRIHHTN